MRLLTMNTRKSMAGCKDGTYGICLPGQTSYGAVTTWSGAAKSIKCVVPHFVFIHHRYPTYYFIPITYYLSPPKRPIYKDEGNDESTMVQCSAFRRLTLINSLGRRLTPTQPRDFVIKQVPIPQINDDEVLLKGQYNQVARRCLYWHHLYYSSHLLR